METLILHPEARTELIETVRYYELAQAGLGLDFRQRVEEAFAEIQIDPLRWRLRAHGYRRKDLTRFPYYIPYVAIDGRIHILAIAHGARKPGYWIRRKD